MSESAISPSSSSTTDLELGQPGSSQVINLDVLATDKVCFSITISALDLATTPFALERAQERLKLDITEETPTPLTSFLENYKPYRGQNRLLRAYEARTLKPFIRSATRSQSILIQHDGNLLRRRIQVTPVPEPSYAFYNKIRRKLLGVQNLHRCLEALDLRLDGRLQIEFEEGPGALLGNTFYGKRRLGRGFFIELIAYSIVVWLVVLVTVVVLNVTSLHFEPGPSPGILLSIVGHACRDQGVLQACNKITPNPDVAGIGGRIALYMQVFLLAVFLTFCPERASSASWALLFTSTAFALSALIATATSQLTLYHVILTNKLQGLPVSILTIVVIYAPRQHRSYIYLFTTLRLAIRAAVVVWYSWAAPCFGSQPECNAYVVTHSWFSSKQAIAPETRVSSLGLAILGITIVSLHRIVFWKQFTLAFQSLFSDKARMKLYSLPCTGIYSETEKENPADWDRLKSWAIAGILEDNSTPHAVRLNIRRRFLGQSSSLPYPVTATITHSSPPPPNRLWILYQTAYLNVRNALRYPKVWRLLIAFGLGGLQVHNIEATISSNRDVVDVGENAWTYGQVMAVIMTAVPVVEAMQLVGLLPSKRNRTKSGHKKKVL